MTRSLMTTLRSAVIAAGATASILGCGGTDAPSGSADTGPMEFIDLRAEDIGANRAVIRFGTSRQTTCEAEYGLQEDVLDLSATDPSMGPELYAFDHEVPLEDLQPATLYHYRARATDEAGDTYFSDVLQFATDVADIVAELTNFVGLDQGTSVSGVSSNFGGVGNDDAWGRTTRWTAS